MLSSWAGLAHRIAAKRWESEWWLTDLQRGQKPRARRSRNCWEVCGVNQAVLGWICLVLREAPWVHQPSPMTSSCAAQGLWETLHKRPKLRSRRGPVMAAMPFCFVAKAPRCTLHSGFNHEESLKAHIIKGGGSGPQL